MHRTPTDHLRSASAAAVAGASGLLASTETVGDPEGTRTISSIVALLIAIGLALVMIAIWLYKTTRPDPDLLAPLEMMGERKWRRSDPVWQRRRLDGLRPEGAEPLEPVTAPPDIDESFDLGPAASGFDDLHGDDEGERDDVGDDVVVAAWPAPVPMDSEPPTPEQLERPALDQLPDGDVDPAALAAAMAEIDAELAGAEPGEVARDVAGDGADEDHAG